MATSDVFGPYELVSLLGRGGMGEVWSAFNTRTGNSVALKLLGAWMTGDTQFAARFRREAALAASIAGPHLVPIHDFGEIDGRLYIEMDRVSGVDLAELIQSSGSLEPSRAITIITQVASALDSAHRAGLMHRDVKPSNVLVSRQGGQDHAFLIDFGIARVADGTKISLTGAVIGTPAYMAPERFDGDGDHRSDVYALACVLFETLTGVPPFQSSNPWGFVKAHHDTPPPRPSSRNPKIPSSLDAVVIRGMAKVASARHATAGSLAREAAVALLAGAGLSTAPATSGSLNRAAPTTVTTFAGPAEATHPIEFAKRSGDSRFSLKARLIAIIAAATLSFAALVVGFSSQSGNSQTTVPTFPTQPSRDPPSVTNPTLAAAIPFVPNPTQNHGQAIELYQEIAVAPNGSVVYVSDTQSSAVTVLDPGRRSIASTISLPGRPIGLAVSPDGLRLYVALGYAEFDAASSVAIVDTTNNGVISQVAVGDRPYGIAVSPDGRTVVVANNASASVSVIDTERRAVVARLSVDQFPSAVAISRDGKHAFVLHSEPAVISVIDLGGEPSVTERMVGFDSQAGGIAVSSDGNTLFVTSQATGVVSLLDTRDASIVSKIRSGMSPTGLAISPNERFLFIANSADGTVATVDLTTKTVTAAVRVGQFPTGVAIAPNGRAVYVSDAVSLTVSVIDTMAT